MSREQLEKLEGGLSMANDEILALQEDLEELTKKLSAIEYAFQQYVLSEDRK